MSEGEEALASPTSALAKTAEEREAWLAQREQGSRAGIRALLLFTRVFGRRGGRLLLRVMLFLTSLRPPLRSLFPLTKHCRCAPRTRPPANNNETPRP